MMLLVPVHLACCGGSLLCSLLLLLRMMLLVPVHLACCGGSLQLFHVPTLAVLFSVDSGTSASRWPTRPSASLCATIPSDRPSSPCWTMCACWLTQLRSCSSTRCVQRVVFPAVQCAPCCAVCALLCTGRRSLGCRSLVCLLTGPCPDSWTSNSSSWM